MSPRPEAQHLGNLVSDIQGALAWRGFLTIVADYKKSDEPADKLIELVNGAVFVLDQLEGKEAMPRLRRTLATLQASLRHEQHARSVARLLSQML